MSSNATHELDQPAHLDALQRAHRLKHAAKVAIAVSVSALVAFIWHVDAGFFVGVICVVVMLQAPLRPFAAAGRLIAVVAFLSMVMMTVMFLFLSVHPAYLFAGCLVLFLWLVYVPSQYTAAYVLGAIVIELLLYERVFSGPGASVSMMGHLIVSFVIAWFVMGVVELVIWPDNPRRTARMMLAELFSRFAALVDALRAGDDGGQERHLQHLSLEAFDRILGVTRFVASNGVAERDPQTVVMGKLVFLKIEGLRRGVQEGRFASVIDAQQSAFDDVLTEVSTLFRNVSDGLVSGDLADLDLAPLASRIDRLQALASPRDGDSERVCSDQTVIPLLRSILTATRRFAYDFQAINTGRIPSSLTEEHRFLPLRRPPAFTLAVPRDKVQQAGRIVLLTLVLMLLLVILRLPGNTPVSFYAIVFGLASNTSRVRWWGESGLVGAFLGMVYGMLCILFISRVPELGVFLPLYAVGLFVSAYVAVGPERNAFAGYQATLIMPFVLLLFNGPQWTLEASITRCVAIGLTAVVAFVLMVFVWPALPVREFKRSTREALLTCARLFPSQTDPSERKGMDEERTRALVLATEALEDSAQDASYLIGHRQTGGFLEICGAVLDFGGELRGMVRMLRNDLATEFGGGGEAVQKLLAGLGPEMAATRRALLDAARALESEAPTALEIDLSESRSATAAKADRLLREEAHDPRSRSDPTRVALFVGLFEDLTRSIERLGVAITRLPDDSGELVAHAVGVTSSTPASTG